MITTRLQRAVFLMLLACSTVAFVWVLSPFSGAIFWAVILALLFNSTFQKLLGRLRGRRNLAALLTLGLIMLIVILPTVLISLMLADEITTLVLRLREGDLNFRAYMEQILAALPQPIRGLMARFDLIDLQSVMDKLAENLVASGQALTTKALSIGQNALVFLVNTVVMLYLLFFFLRDGQELSQLVRHTIPMARPQAHYLANKFATVVRATVKGNVVVAMVQGFLGGVALWALDIRGALLWGVVMAFLSLLPAVGASLIWGPVAIYLLATGSVWQGVALIVWGAVVIGMSDNVLRPVLVGKDTRLPDYVVLLTTLGGISLFGISGFVIGPTIAALFMAMWALFQRTGENLPAHPGEDASGQPHAAGADAQHPPQPAAETCPPKA